VAIDQFFPSSKRCSCCGFTIKKMPLDVRKWQCPECGADHDRDINAARNIKAAGLAVLACGEPVNPESLNATQVRLRETRILALQGGVRQSEPPHSLTEPPDKNRFRIV
ncbi:TPA: zinc ribbon domain-containing protein, partial [Salmonella enterica]